MAHSNRSDSLRLSFIIAGGGIAGLATAYLLAEAGHYVHVIEKQDLNAPSGPVRVPPNLSKILRRWVGSDELSRHSKLCTHSPFHDLSSGELVGHFYWKPTVMAETGGDFLVMHHADLHRMLHELATAAGARVSLNTSIAAVHAGTSALPNPSVCLSTGEILSADFLIAADGPKSFVRGEVWGPGERQGVPGMTLYTGVVDAAPLLDDEMFRRVVEQDDWAIFMGTNRSLCCHSVRGRKELGFHIYSHPGDESATQEGEEGWDEVIPSSSVNVRDGRHAPQIHKLLSLTTSLIRTRFVQRPDDAIENWVDSTGRIVLIGEAAHPWLPGGSHGAAMAVEDAVVLGTLFARLSSHAQLPSFVAAYQELRQTRCAAVRAADVANALLVALPAGEAQVARDTALVRERDEWDEGNMKAQFEEIKGVFGYDAVEAADEWWVCWGRFGGPVSISSPPVRAPSSPLEARRVSWEWVARTPSTGGELSGATEEYAEDEGSDGLITPVAESRARRVSWEWPGWGTIAMVQQEVEGHRSCCIC